ncbi:MAG TPA: histidinol dehydrogenase, partial [Alphaproteobacteria bacterium]|nr:histidinol dehydrogenase [Alphaproteobacteria bacterium]
MEKILNYNNKNFIEKLNFFISNSRGTGLDISEQVKNIISNVMKDGDKAINELTVKYDNYDIFKNGIRVSENDINKAYDACEKELIYALEQAVERIRAFHELQLPKNISYIDDSNVSLGSRWS